MNWKEKSRFHNLDWQMSYSSPILLKPRIIFLFFSWPRLYLYPLTRNHSFANILLCCGSSSVQGLRLTCGITTASLVSQLSLTDVEFQSHTFVTTKWIALYITRMRFSNGFLSFLIYIMNKIFLIFLLCYITFIGTWFLKSRQFKRRAQKTDWKTNEECKIKLEIRLINGSNYNHK